MTLVCSGTRTPKTKLYTPVTRMRGTGGHGLPTFQRICLSVPRLHQATQAESTAQQNHAYCQREQTCEFPSVIKNSQASSCRGDEANESCDPYCPESQLSHVLSFYRSLG